MTDLQAGEYEREAREFLRNRQYWHELPSGEWEYAGEPVGLKMETLLAAFAAQRDQEHARRWPTVRNPQEALNVRERALVSELLQAAKDARAQLNELGLVASAVERLQRVIEKAEKERKP